MTIGYEYRPGTLYLNVTNRCSNDCTFCVRQAPSFGEAAYPAVLDFIRRCVGRFEAVTVTVVGFTLEPEDLARCERIAGELGAGFRVR